MPTPLFQPHHPRHRHSSWSSFTYFASGANRRVDLDTVSAQVPGDGRAFSPSTSPPSPRRPQALANATREVVRTCELVEIMLQRVIGLYEVADDERIAELAALDDQPRREARGNQALPCPGDRWFALRGGDAALPRASRGLREARAGRGHHRPQPARSRPQEDEARPRVHRGWLGRARQFPRSGCRR